MLQLQTQIQDEIRSVESGGCAQDELNSSRRTVRLRNYAKLMLLRFRAVLRTPRRLPCIRLMASAEGTAGPLMIHGQAVEVTAEPGIDVSVALRSSAFQDWKERVAPDLLIRGIHLQSLDMFGSRVGFLKFRADVTREGKRVPGIVFMRGGAVAILRFPIGSSGFAEIPAGMLDGESHFVGVVAHEMEEETGIRVTAEELVDLTAKAFGMPLRGGELPPGSRGRGAAAEARWWQGAYPTPGGSDEFIRLYALERRVSRAELEDIRGRVTGCAHENEHIQLELCPWDDAWRHSPDMKTLSALLLYEKLKASGEI